MSRQKSHDPRPALVAPAGEQQLSSAAWAEIVKVIRALTPPQPA